MSKKKALEITATLVAIISLVWAVFWNLFTYLKADSSEKFSQTHNGSGDNVGGDKNVTNNFVVKKFSESEIISLPNGNRKIDLDGAGTLTFETEGGNNENHIALYLNVVRIEIPNPQHGQTIDTGDGFATFGDTNVSSSQVMIADAYYKRISDDQLYVFDNITQKQHEIKTGGRIFFVTLNRIEILNNPKSINYYFSTSEK